MSNRDKFYDPFKMIDSVILENNLKVCPNCKARNEQKAKFCFVCGFKFLGEGKKDDDKKDPNGTTVLSDTGKDNKNLTEKKSLKVRLEQENGKVFVLEHFPLSLGKEKKSCDIQIESNVVSRRHAIISFSNDKYWIEDNSSTNGTFVNGARLEPKKKRELSNNDVIRLANVNLNFLME